MSQFVETIFRVVEEYWETVKKNGIPAAMLRDQIPRAAIPPATSTDKGGVTISTSTPNAIGTADPGSGSAVSAGSHVHAHGNQTGGALHSVATTSVAGFESAADKTKLDALSTTLASHNHTSGAGDGGVLTNDAHDGYSDYAEIAAPAAPAANNARLYTKDVAGVTEFFYKNSAGTERDLSSTGGGSSLTIEEVDGTPSESAPSKLIFPNGTLSLAGDEVTYTPTGGGSGNATSTGAAGSEPGSPASGDLYLPNNGFVVERYSGSVWAPWGPIYPLTEPPAVASGWTWVNQSTAAFVDEGTSRYLSAVNSSDNNLVVRTVSAPYTVTACYLWHGDVLTGANDGGLCFYDSSGGKLITVGHSLFSGVITEFIRKWNSTSSHSGGDYIAFGLGAARVRSFPFWVRLIDDSTNRKIQYSVDGQHWITRHSIGRTDFMTADRVGLYLRSASSGTSQLTLLSWVQ